MDLCELLEEYRNEKRMHCMEGSSGVANLCKICDALGYSNVRLGHYGDAPLGSLVDFLEDNPGAIEAIVTWIGEQNIPEWKESIESELPERGICPACGEPLQDDVCQNTDCDS